MDKFHIVLMVLLAVSEGLAVIPQVQSNSIFQLALSILSKIAGK